MCSHGFAKSTEGATGSSEIHWCASNGSLPIISLQIGETFHHSHVPVIKTRDEETAKSCDPCARVLWSNVHRSGCFASSLMSVQFQTGLGRVRQIFTYLHHEQLRFRFGDTYRGGTVDQLSRLLWPREIFAYILTSQSKSYLFHRLAGWHSRPAGNTSLTCTV